MSGPYIKHSKYRSAQSLDNERRELATLTATSDAVDRGVQIPRLDKTTPREPLKGTAMQSTALVLYDPHFAAVSSYTPPPPPPPAAIAERRESIEPPRTGQRSPRFGDQSERAIRQVEERLHVLTTLATEFQRIDLLMLQSNTAINPDLASGLFDQLQTAQVEIGVVKSRLSRFAAICKKQIPTSDTQAGEEISQPSDTAAPAASRDEWGNLVYTTASGLVVKAYPSTDKKGYWYGSLTTSDGQLFTTAHEAPVPSRAGAVRKAVKQYRQSINESREGHVLQAD